MSYTYNSPKLTITIEFCFWNLDENKCFCEFQSGRGEKSGVLCETNGTFQRAFLCGLDQICSGSSSEEEAVNDTSELCTYGKQIINKKLVEHW